MNKGAPTAADLLLIFDSMARPLNRVYTTMGLGLPGEASTYAADWETASRAIMGDGTTTYPGLSDPVLAQQLQTYITTGRASAPYDRFTNTTFGPVMGILLDDAVRNNLPYYTESGVTKQWSFSTSSKRMLDMHLLRMNANHADAPVAPTGTPTITATTGGSIPAGTGRRIKLSLVGDTDWKESLPGAASTQVALSGANNAYTIGGLPSGNVGTGVYKLRAYCQLVGAGAGDPYYFAKDFTVVPGVAWSTYTTFTITESDGELRQDWQPASYAQCIALPETAFEYAVALATLSRTGSLMDLSSIAMFSPTNVALNPTNGFFGYNPSSTGLFGTWASTTYTAGTIRTTNDAANGLQGYAGGVAGAVSGGGVRARVTSALDGNASLSNIGYTYYDSTHATTPQSGTIVGALTLNLALGSTVDLAIPAGQIVLSVTGVTVGTATTGTFIFEANALRTL